MIKEFIMTEDQRDLSEFFIVDHSCDPDVQAGIDYIFSHKSGIGLSVFVECSCGASQDLTDYGSW